MTPGSYKENVPSPSDFFLHGQQKAQLFLNNPFQQFVILFMHTWEQIVGLQLLWAYWMQQCGRSYSPWFSFSTTLECNNEKTRNYFWQFCQVPFQSGSCRKLYFLHFQLSLGLCPTKLAQKENIHRVCHGLRFLYKAEGVISLVDNEGSQAVPFSNGRASRWVGWDLFSGWVALGPVEGRALRVGNDLELVIIIMMTTDALQIGEREGNTALNVLQHKYKTTRQQWELQKRVDDQCLLLPPVPICRSTDVKSWKGRNSFIFQKWGFHLCLGRKQLYVVSSPQTEALCSGWT